MAGSMKAYSEELDRALGDAFLGRTMDAFARAYPQGRANAFLGMDTPGMVAEVAALKDRALCRLGELYQEFRDKAEADGVRVHLARDAAEANAIVARIARDEGCAKIAKSKSMTSEETGLNHHLEAEGFEVSETDLGEWIIQLRREGPTHMVMPAIHLSRNQVADLFSRVTGAPQPGDVERLVKVARRELRPAFTGADMGFTGANFCIAENGAVGLVTNEGNARLVTTFPRVQVALAGLDKLVPTLDDALRILKVLPRNATGQAITSYVTWIKGRPEHSASPDGRVSRHVVFLDNGRTELVKDPVFGQVLRCIRCGACANVCPVYRMVGGRGHGHIYIGAIGLILTYFFHDKDKAAALVKNCINCQACKAVCAAGIDLPGLIKALLARIQDEKGHPLDSRLLAKAMSNRRLFHGLLRAASHAQKVLGARPSATGRGMNIRHLPMLLSARHGFREIPCLADIPFRDAFVGLRERVDAPRLRVGLFGGCAGDFIFPEQLASGLGTFRGRGVDVRFPMDQTCCGLPLMMLGESRAERETARRNVRAFADLDLDAVVCLCPSCASHLKRYPDLLRDDPEYGEPARRFAGLVTDYSSFLLRQVGVAPGDFLQSGPRAAYHAPCHLCRGLGVYNAPRELIRISGYDYVRMEEEDVCCGFGGTYSMKFPAISGRILGNKLAHLRQSGAEVLITDCPGCVMQIRGGLDKQNSPIQVRHMSEALAQRMLPRG